MTKRKGWRVKNPCSKEDSEFLFEQIKQIIKNSGLDNRLNRIEKDAKRILESEPIPNRFSKDADRMRVSWEPDSNGYFAKRILEKLHVIRVKMEEGNWAIAIDYALDVGALVTEFNFKKGFELDWQLGKGRRQQVKDFSNKGVEAQIEVHRPNWEVWQRLANEIWAKNPGRSKLFVAEKIADKTSASKHTIRKHIKNHFKK